MKTAAFRLDASPVIGLGHLARCSSLMKELRRFGWQCILVCSPETVEVGGEFLTAANSIVRVDADHAFDVDMFRQDVGRADVVFIDHYQCPLDFERRLVQSGVSVVAIEDDPTKEHAARFLLNSCFGLEDGQRGDAVNVDQWKMFGSEYALLRPEFRIARIEKEVGQKVENGPGRRRVFVGFGGGDPGGISVLATRALLQSDLDIEIDLVVSKSVYAFDPRLAELDADYPTLTVHVSPPDVAAVMKDADVAVGAAGGMALERCALGLPTGLILCAENQRDQMQQLISAGVALDAGELGDFSADKLISTVHTLLLAGGQAEQMAETASRYVDGLGAKRVLLDVSRSTSSIDQPVKLEILSDAYMLLLHDWQSSAGARTYSRNPAVPTVEEHCRWFGKATSDPGQLLCLITHAGIPGGYVSLRPWNGDTGNGAWEVSILLAPEMRGKGIGLHALNGISDYVGGGHLNAYVHPENTASQRLFERAGYVRGPDDVYQRTV